MRCLLRNASVSLYILILVFLLVDFASAYSIPAGFYQIESAPGVVLYTSNDNTHYVQVIDLSECASLKLLDILPEEQIPCPSNQEGNSCDPCDVDGPYFPRQSLNTFWNDTSNEFPYLFSVTNGTFFEDRVPQSVPVPLAFSLKVNGTIKTCGYDSNYPDDMLLLELSDNGTATITQASLSRSRIKDPTAASNILGGLSHTAERYDRNEFKERTFIGIIDNNIVLILTSKYATQTSAAQILTSFEVREDKIIMLDGGGSTQMIYLGIPQIEFSRWVPQAIAVLSAHYCHYYNSSHTIDDRYGVPYNVLYPEKETLIKILCDSSKVTVEVGSGLPNQYIYHQGYIYRYVNSEWKWEPYFLSGPNSQFDGFFVTKATATIDLSPEELQDWIFLVAYICTWTGTEWKCGCRDESCASAFWQLQVFRQ